MSESSESDFDVLQERDALFMSRRIGMLRAALVPSVPLTDEARDCDDCGDDIPRPRLLALPNTFRCVSCQALSERRW